RLLQRGLERLLRPERLSSCWIERLHETDCVGGVEYAIHQRRRRHQVRRDDQTGELLAQGGIDPRPPPEDAQLADIARVDLRVRGVSLRSPVAAEIAPGADSRSRGLRGQRGGRGERPEQGARQNDRKKRL